MATAAPDLQVRGEPVERVYGNFVERRYVVNRRYQRKLIWTLEEKQEFIDSLIRGYPVPIILLAESANRESNDLEIIDGMQRLDTIFSFIENKYPVSGKYFDLETMASTKQNLDSGSILQNHPKMDRAQCVKIASYLIPLSIYEFADEGSVDNVFRRINSGGRQLSRQELRSAGAVGHFATVVRRLAAKVRGDDSSSDILKLNEMQKISITNRDLNYGIDVDSLFWVNHGILSRDNVRKSQDEELIADIVSYMVYDNSVSSRTELLDDYYGSGNDNSSQARYSDIERFVQRRTIDLVTLDFTRTLDQIRLTLSDCDKSFSQLLFTSGQDNPIPRYFQAVFLAFHDLLIKQSQAVIDRSALAFALLNSGPHINVQGGGGRWGADNRQKAINSVVGMITKSFGPSEELDPSKILWITQLENLLSQSYTEQSAYDFKQGFFNLANEPAFDDESFEKILKTLVAISNLGPSKLGYVIVGVAENSETALRVEKLFGTSSNPFQSFWISGVDHEANRLGKSPDEMFQWIVEKVKLSLISEPLRGYIASHIKPVRYYDKTVYVFEAKGMPDEPSRYDKSYFERRGAQLEEVEATNLGQLFRRYLS